MWCALLTPSHLEIHFIYKIPWNDVPLLFQILSSNPYKFCEALRQTDTRYYFSYDKYCKEDGQRWPVWHIDAIWSQKAKIDPNCIRYCLHLPA